MFDTSSVIPKTSWPVPRVTMNEGILSTVTRNALIAADGGRGHEGQHDGKPDRPAPDDPGDADQDRRQAVHVAEREVDLADDDDQREPQRHDRDGAHRAHHAQDVGDRQERVRLAQEGEDDDRRSGSRSAGRRPGGRPPARVPTMRLAAVAAATGGAGGGRSAVRRPSGARSSCDGAAASETRPGRSARRRLGRPARDRLRIGGQPPAIAMNSSRACHDVLLRDRLEDVGVRAGPCRS